MSKLNKRERGKLVNEYLDNNADMATRTLARKIMDENSDSFDSVDQIRTLIRRRRGKLGEANRKASIRNENSKYFVSKTPKATHKTDGLFAPKILIFDIETTPIKAWVWKHYKENIMPAQVIQETKLLCFVAKWLGNDTIMFDSTKGKRTDKSCCKSLWKLFDEADIVVAHNGKAFDSKTMRARWIKHGFNPPSPYKQVDTLKVAQANFRFGMNKLDYLGRYLEIGKKTEHEGFDLWLKCMKNDDKAWERMEEYNIQDVLLLEELYLKIRAWDKKHPNLATMYDDTATRCMACGGKDIKEIPQASFTNISVFPSYRCKNCGKIMRSGKRDEVDKTLLRHSL